MTVPHFYQSSQQTCGAACLRMVFAALAVTHDEATIARHCGLTPFGCTVQDLVTGAQALGFNAALLKVTSEPAAIAALSHETPFIAMIDVGSLPQGGSILQWHFVVPLGLALDVVAFHDPVDGPDRQAKLDDFLAAWATAAYLGVRLWKP